MAAVLTFFRLSRGARAGLSPSGVRESLSRRVAATRWLHTALGMVLLLFVYGSWQLFRWTPSGDQRLAGDAFFYPVGLAAVWMAMSWANRLNICFVFVASSGTQ